MTMAKRCFDVIASGVALVLVGPFLAIVLLAIYWQDRQSPIYAAVRVGKDGRPFRMYKVRSMVVNAEKLGGTSSGSDDPRITKVGLFVRKCKLDELSQLWNVFVGDMSLVGPRPNTIEDVKLYTQVEQRLFDVPPGITDFSSIVFADEGEILKDRIDADIAYNQLIRPIKSRLGLFYIEHRSLWLDIKICALTAVAIVFRDQALAGIQVILNDLGAPEDLQHLASRSTPLLPMPPPGTNRIVTFLDGDPVT